MALAIVKHEESIVKTRSQVMVGERKARDVLLMVQYCIKKQDRFSCCTKGKIFTLTILYYLITANDWVSTIDVANKTKIAYYWVSRYLRRLLEWGIVERRYIPSRPVLALWRIKEEVFNGYSKMQVLDVLKKHIEMCVGPSVAGAMQFSETA
jgi:DNA-binding HxlR family transcriptional regulator